MSHPDGPLETYAAIGAATGVYLFYRGFQDLKLGRLVSATATSKVRSAAVGPVELCGRARPGPVSLSDPIYSQSCCFYDITISQLVRSGKSSHWKVIRRDTSAEPFYLEDETGAIAVYPTGAQLILQKAVEWRLRQTFFMQDIASAELAYARAACPSGQVKVDAYIVREGQPLFLFGYAAPQAAVPAAALPSFEQYLRAFKADPARMKTLDKNGDGELGLDEWDDAVAGTIRQQWQALHAAAPPAAEALVVRQEAERTFLITDEQESELLWGLEWRSWLKILGGPALTIACVAFLAHSLHLL